MAHGEATQIPEIKKSIVEIRYLSEEEKIRLQAEYREKALHDEASAMSDARMKGFAEGFAEGFAKGFAEGKAEVRRAVESKMRNMGYSEEQIKAIVGEESYLNPDRCLYSSITNAYGRLA